MVGQRLVSKGVPHHVLASRELSSTWDCDRYYIQQCKLHCYIPYKYYIKLPLFEFMTYIYLYMQLHNISLSIYSSLFTTELCLRVTRCHILHAIIKPTVLLTDRPLFRSQQLQQIKYGYIGLLPFHCSLTATTNSIATSYIIGHLCTL